MQVYEIYFSPTGGTTKVADYVSRALATKVIPIDLTDSHADFNTAIPEQDALSVIAVPSYGGRVPAPAVERLRALQGNNVPTVLICVYGNRAYEDTLVELADTAKQAGFHIIAAIAAIAEHSIARQFATGRPDTQDQEQLLEFAKQIQTKLSAGEFAEPVLPGNHPYKKTSGTSMIPKPTKKCTNCGICAAQCPVQAIAADNPKQVNSKACISCMRCISVCPHSARTVNPVMLSVVDLALKKICSDRKSCELFL